MTTKPLYPKLQYESNDRDYILSAYSVTRNYSIGDGGFVEMEFPVAIIDKVTNMVCVEVTYKILSTSFEKEVTVDKIERHKDTIDYIVSREGCFVEPEPPGTDIALKLLDLLVKYLELNRIR